MRITGYLILFLLSVSVYAQSQNEEHLHEHHEHPSNEIGIANTLVHFVNENQFAYGLHAHYVYNLKDNKYGVGIGYERIFDEHRHNSIVVIASYSPFHKLNFHLAPGITFEDGKSAELDFGVHIETSYEFEISHFHVGPILEFAYHPEDIHLSTGIHFGFGF
ncbi:MAG: hypothetical protein K9H49_07645 [Bacteroidales bacterium]|nr:hypothetical protein [Bacteroidales bacterium]MCF8404507.1 hypothetical protein [Bacteroidales bacterium]